MRGGAPDTGVWAQVKERLGAEAGVTAIEYALMAALIAVVIVIAVASVGSELRIAYSYVADCVKNLACQ